MHLLVFVIICFIYSAQGMSRFKANDVYHLIHHASSQSKVSEQCRSSLDLYVKNFNNITSDDQWALQSEYTTLLCFLYNLAMYPSNLFPKLGIKNRCLRKKQNIFYLLWNLQITTLKHRFLGHISHAPFHFQLS